MVRSEKFWKGRNQTQVFAAMFQSDYVWTAFFVIRVFQDQWAQSTSTVE